MGTMTTDETYNEASEPRSGGHMKDESFNGYANRETWAFNLHWQNDQGLYADTLEYANGIALEGADPYSVGEDVVAYWRDTFEGYDMDDTPMPAAYRRFRTEVGSWWRIDYREVGEAVIEALDAESD